MCTDTRLESYNPAAFEHILLSPEEYHNKDRYRCYPIQPFARSAAAAELSNDNLKTTESIYKTLFFIMEYYFRTPSFYTLLEEQNNPHYKAGFWDFIWDRLREMRKTFTSQTINANALYEMEMHPQHGITYRNKDLSAGDKPPNNFIISLDTFQRERRQGIHILEFTVAILLVGCASFATSAKDELRDFVIGKKSLFLESLSQCFTELISYYRLNRKKRVGSESEREEDCYYYYSKKNSEFISLMLLQSGLELNKKVEDRSSFLPTHGIDVLKSTGETETVTVAEEPHDSVSFASVYTEIHNHAKLFDNQNHKRNNPFIQNVLDVMDCINARNYYQFFYLLGGRDVTPDHQNGTNMEQFVQINPTQNRKFTFYKSAC
ncbi:hypothetical protein AGDE_12423 [Angomonas deanei]|uniref:Uncharacterized protein n=1 Tax=Angomonas deanei TaxID=59799 RepID=A0A7G2CNV7_9TRYP|nr:hypothetical protein AGDE_12423 [Angomonas deanei]CAD2220631.1 hypothetical protein, conserved [Angomonas deanei]|eukprot:EPY24288.1 hypothetical protein AGDE_12423 [Angomonas deanei]